MTMMNIARPVMLKDIAEKLGLPLSSVRDCMKTNSAMSKQKIDLVRQTADEMGYNTTKSRSYCGKINGQKAKGKPTVCHEKTCVMCGKLYVPNSNRQQYCLACRGKYHKEYFKKYHGRCMNYYNGNFKTKAEEVTRMKELRAMGYSNTEIAKAIGRCYDTVHRNIGKQDVELSTQNRVMAAHIRAQKNAARRQYVLNKPIREYNAKVEKHNKMKAELNLLQTELLTEKPEIMKAAQTEIKFPMVDLKTLQPTALQ